MVDQESQPPFGDRFEAWVGDDQEVAHPTNEVDASQGASSSGGQERDDGNPSHPAPPRSETAGEADRKGPPSGSETSPRVSPLTPASRRIRLPVILFLLTCLSTFLVGATFWLPSWYLIQAFETESLMPLRRALVANWRDGLLYSGCLLGILMTHEMGHFLVTIFYRIPASFPYFLPLPITPIGTLGAVISMDGRRANRKEIFDIGLAGPIAGLVVALPVLWIGVQQLDFTEPARGVFALDAPLLVRWMMDWVQPKGYEPGADVWIGQIRGNPFFMAGWVGSLLTGLNMLPVSQLDGGHVTYTLFGKAAHWIARIFMLVALVFIWYVGALRPWGLMFFLVLLIGVDHPPTRDDRVEIGWTRAVIGATSLLIPILCLPPRLIYM